MLFFYKALCHSFVVKFYSAGAATHDWIQFEKMSQTSLKEVTFKKRDTYLDLNGIYTLLQTTRQQAPINRHCFKSNCPNATWAKKRAGSCLLSG
jgi:hypothetical protein